MCGGEVERDRRECRCGYVRLEVWDGVVRDGLRVHRKPPVVHVFLQHLASSEWLHGGMEDTEVPSS